jgi:alpha-amylase/alpha-mannosidase (GH57 family)
MMYYLPFAVHNHQPVGNFDYIFKKAIDDCHFPFLKIASEFPFFRFTLHFSGPLFEWMEEKRPEVISLIQKMVRKEQIELMAGGFYEPLLPFIPERDAKGQIKYMMDYLEKRLGYLQKGHGCQKGSGTLIYQNF